MKNTKNVTDSSSSPADDELSELKASRDRYRVVVDNVPAMICRFRPDGTLTFVNDPYCRYFNKTRRELIGYNFLNFIPEEFREEVRNKYTSLTLETPSVTYEHPVETSEGVTVWHRWTDRILACEGSCVTEYLSLGEDITVQKQYEQSLVESEARYRLLAENISDIIWIFDMETKLFTYISPSLTRVLGYLPEDAVKHGIKRALTPDSYKYLINKISERVKHYKQGRRETYIDELEHIHKNGTPVWCELVLTVNMNEATGHLEAYGITRDISDRKRAEIAIRQLVMERG